MKILVGISGGVDSAAAAKMLIDQGHTVEGCVLMMHKYTELQEAKRVSSDLGIALHILDARDSFENIIKKNFVQEYSRGRTPNPCILCNEKVKFRFLYDYAGGHGFDAIATGHYAEIVKVISDGEVRYTVKRAGDANKDQTYMLYRLPEDILSRLILPLSNIKKEEVRKMARENSISSADREDSQEICFLPDGDHPAYIEGVLGKFEKGSFIDEEGRVLGEHKGIIRYTVGQRKGLGISLGERAFVTEIDPINNTVKLSPRYEGRSVVNLSDTVFSGIAKPKDELAVTVFVKIRYTAPLAEAVAIIHDDGTAELRFNSPVKAAPGQSAVAYDGEGRVLFGGIIDA